MGEILKGVMVRKKALICIVFSMLMTFFLQGAAFPDIVTLKDSYEKYEGNIIDVQRDGLLLESPQGCTWSFSGDKIGSIELKLFNVPVPHSQNIPGGFLEKRFARKAVFDRLTLKEGGSFLGAVEVETPEAVYFSLLTTAGIAIVEFKRNEVEGVARSYGAKRKAAELYFRWRYFLHDLKLVMSKKEEEGISSDDYLQDYIYDVEVEGFEGGPGQRRVFTLRSLRKFLGKEYRYSDEERYAIGVKRKKLMLGMPPECTDAMFGKPLVVRHMDGKGDEYRSYPNGFAAVFHDGKLFKYTKKSREKITEDVNRYFGDKVKKIAVVPREHPGNGT
jgi:hypothetical protein